MNTVLEISNLRVGFIQGGALRSVLNDVCLSVGAGEVVALVGESGSGKSLTALSILRLLPEEAKTTGGRISLNGKDVTMLEASELRQVRGRDAAIVFQDPGECLNPVLTVGHQLIAVIRRHHSAGRRDAWRHACELLEEVGISSPSGRLHLYPHQLSGGMQQRILIAMALACSPRLLIADEPTSALDVTIEAQILNLLLDLRRKRQMAILFVTHNLAIAGMISDRVAVMHGGTIIETGNCMEMLNSPSHPYTQALLKAAMSTGRQQPLFELPARKSMPDDGAEGCRFASRCSLAHDICSNVRPGITTLAADHQVRCHAIKSGVRQ